MITIKEMAKQLGVRSYNSFKCNKWKNRKNV